MIVLRHETPNRGGQVADGDDRSLFVDGAEAGQVRLATSYFARLRGLLGSRPGAIPLLLFPANSVHGVGMTYALDVASLDDTGRVVHVSRLHPFGHTRPRRGVTSVLEATSGSFNALGITPGVVLTWSAEPVPKSPDEAP
jgi:uncharacterized membrane protein (UPF0127 family)